MWVAAAIVGGAIIGGVVSSNSSSKAARAATQGATAEAQAAIAAAEIQAEYQKEALDYLKQTEELPQQFREGALKRVAGAAGLEGGEGSQQELIDKALASPLYGAIMGGKEAGEEAILRSASATGGLRSGNVQRNLYDYNVQLENQALLTSYNEQMSTLQGLANLPSNANAIAQQTSSIGATLGSGTFGAGAAMGQGYVAAGQAYQAGGQQTMNNVMGMTNLGISAYGAGMFSDRRLKKDIKLIGEANGYNLYSWSWNIVAQKMGLTGKTIGCMADEIYVTDPDVVSIKDMFLFVNYNKIGVLL